MSGLMGATGLPFSPNPQAMGPFEAAARMGVSLNGPASMANSGGMLAEQNQYQLPEGLPPLPPGVKLTGPVKMPPQMVPYQGKGGRTFMGPAPQDWLDDQGKPTDTLLNFYTSADNQVQDNIKSMLSLLMQHGSPAENMEKVPLYGLNGQTRFIYHPKGTPFTPPEGWSLIKPPETGITRQQFLEKIFRENIMAKPGEMEKYLQKANAFYDQYYNSPSGEKPQETPPPSTTSPQGPPQMRMKMQAVPWSPSSRQPSRYVYDPATKTLKPK